MLNNEHVLYTKQDVLKLIVQRVLYGTYIILGILYTLQKNTYITF